MEGEAWRSVEVVRNNVGEPHVFQQKATVYTTGVSEESSGYTRPEIQHRLVPLKSLVDID